MVERLRSGARIEYHDGRFVWDGGGVVNAAALESLVAQGIVAHEGRAFDGTEGTGYPYWSDIRLVPDSEDDLEGDIEAALGVWRADGWSVRKSGDGWSAYKQSLGRVRLTKAELLAGAARHNLEGEGAA